MIARFEESGVPWSAAFGIWNAKTVFFGRRLARNRGPVAGDRKLNSTDDRKVYTVRAKSDGSG
jgi:hypothetical protein